MYVHDFLTQITSLNVKFIVNEHKQNIMDEFIDRFIDRDIVPKNILLWNSIKTEYRKLVIKSDIDIIKDLPIPTAYNLYIYLERERELFMGRFDTIISFYEQQEPWEETDITIFDDSLNWIISFTHEDEIIKLNLVK
jgi:hypothetical protein